MAWFAIAVAKIGAGLIVWALALRHGEGPVTVLPPVLHGGLLLTFAASGIALVAASRRDEPARALGFVFCLFASVFADSLLRLSGATPDWDGLRRLLLAAAPAALAPYYFWRFAWEFPRVQPALVPVWLPRLLGRLTFVAGTLLFGLAIVLSLSPFAGSLTTPDVLWPTTVALEIPGLALLVMKARTALPDERRRVTLFIAGLVLGMTPLLADTLLSALVPPYAAFFAAPARSRAVSVVIGTAMLVVPFVTAYAVVVDRALETRLIVRLAIQYALARYTVIGLLLVPLGFLVRHLYLHRREPLVEILTKAPPHLWYALLGLTLALLWIRRPLLDAIDRRYFREQHDARQILASLTDSAKRVASLEQLARLVVEEVDKALHVRHAALLIRHGAGFEDPLGAIPPLQTSGTLATLLGGSTTALDVDLSKSGSALRRLPPADLEWMRAARAAVVLPLVTTAGSLDGLMVLGDKRSETRYTPEDRLLLQAVANSTAFALEQLLRQRTPSHPGASAVAAAEACDEPAGQCERCERLFEPATRTCETCHQPLRPAAIPIVLAGKFRAVRRLGSGGMGIVYRADDVTLGRPVAIKTLPHLSEAAARRLRREARALASLHHPHLEAIYGVETWRGVPMVVLEYLSGGTLAARMRNGPLEFRAVIDIGIAMADALHSLHRVGVLHRDIKPSNLGFTSDGTPKLLDFGLAVVGVRDAHDVADDQTGYGQSITHTEWPPLRGGDPSSGLLAGTPLYMSPEAVEGAAPDVSFDLWGLSVTLYEAIAGRNPFVARDRFETARLIASASVPDIRTLRSDCPNELALLLNDALSPERRSRPQSARELEGRLRAMAAAA